jgi:methyl-accepting chemotaxis protein
MLKNLLPLKHRIHRHANSFAASLSEEFVLDHASLVSIGDRVVPALYNGRTSLNLNFDVPDRFTNDTGVTATIFVRSGDDFIRITTSVKKQDGQRAVGTALDRSHPAYKPLMSGESYVGFATIFGVQYMTQYDPVYSQSGQVVGIRYVGLDVSNVGGLGLAARIGLTVSGVYGISFAGFCIATNGMMSATAQSLSAGFGTVSSLLIFGMVYSLIHRNVNVTMSRGKMAAQTIANGDLSAQIHVDRHDDMGQMLQAINGISVGLASMVNNVSHATENINTAAQQIAAGNSDLSSRTESQAASLQQTASSMHQLTATVKTNAESANEADALVSSISSMAGNGGNIVGEVVLTMGKIKSDAHRIADIIGLIDGIAFQTNILALNAAVEAARAGEQGRGFAVVATEVRNLAQRSAAAAKEIKTLVTASVESVEKGNELASTAGQTMASIVESVKHAAILVNGIATASNEQSKGIDEINRAIGQMDDLTQQNAALVEQAAAAAMSLRDQASSLSNAVSAFKMAA